MNYTIEQLISLFANLSNWQERYRQLVLLAKSLPPLPDEFKIEQFQISGCENRVWLVYKLSNEQTLIFEAESEGRIVKGLLVILLTFINNKTADEILEIDILSIFKQLRIIDELSDSRQLGLQNIINKIITIAKQYI